MKKLYNMPWADFVKVNAEDLMNSGLALMDNPNGDNDRSIFAELFG